MRRQFRPALAPGLAVAGRGGLLVKKNPNRATVCDFLRHLRRHLRGPVLVLWDNGKIHSGEPIWAFCRQFPRLHLEPFPGYAPSPAEESGTTCSGSSRTAVVELAVDLTDSLEALRRSPTRLVTCITRADSQRD